MNSIGSVIFNPDCYSSGFSGLRSLSSEVEESAGYDYLKASSGYILKPKNAPTDLLVSDASCGYGESAPTVYRGWSSVGRRVSLSGKLLFPENDYQVFADLNSNNVRAKDYDEFSRFMSENKELKTFISRLSRYLEYSFKDVMFEFEVFADYESGDKTLFLNNVDLLEDIDFVESMIFSEVFEKFWSESYGKVILSLS